jgi:hypothetical protein
LSVSGATTMMRSIVQSALSTQTMTQRRGVPVVGHEFQVNATVDL